MGMIIRMTTKVGIICMVKVSATRFCSDFCDVMKHILVFPSLKLIESSGSALLDLELVEVDDHDHDDY